MQIRFGSVPFATTRAPQSIARRFIPASPAFIECNSLRYFSTLETLWDTRTASCHQGSHFEGQESFMQRATITGQADSAETKLYQGASPQELHRPLTTDDG
jgi:hypothetical protein